ncbi:MAG: hypothetical protein GF331_26670 [Chitinivibrionales bacterium]|nr:hypothetical protein [Chitinivibrionales bacterium]
MRVRNCLLLSLVFTCVVQAGTQLSGVSGGIAIAIGNGADGMNPGFNVGAETLGRPHKIIAVGASAEYQRLTVRFSASAPSDLHASVHILQFSGVPRLFGQITEDFSVFFEADPGLHLVIARIWTRSYWDSEVNPRFGLNIGTGCIFKSLLFCGEVKQTFVKDGVIRSLAFSLGYEYGASWRE